MSGEVALLFVASVGLRVLPRLLLPRSVSSDAYFHLAMARAIRENRHRLPERVPRVLLPNRYTYPFLYHWLLSFVPEGRLPAAERFGSAGIDFAYALLSWAFARALLETTGAPFDPRAPLWVGLLVATAPAFLRVGTGPRAYHGSPRALGELFFLAYMGALLLAESGGDAGWLALAVLAAAAMSVTSKFANQAAVLGGAALACMGRFEPLITWSAGLALAALLSRGHALNVVVGQIKHSIFYVRHVQGPYLHRAHRVPSAYLRNAAASLRSPRRAVAWFFSDPYPPHVVMCAFPHLLVLAALVVCSGAAPPEAPGLARLTAASGAWIAASLIVMALTSWRRLLFLGEGERYLEHTLMPQLLLLVVLAPAPLLWGLLAYALLSYPVHVLLYVRTFRPWQEVHDHLLPLLAQVDRDGTRLYAVGTYFWPLLWGTRRAQVLCNAANNDEALLDAAEWNAVFGNYPYPGNGIGPLVDRFGITHVVESDGSVRGYEAVLGQRPEASVELEVVATSGSFRLSRVCGDPRRNRLERATSSVTPQ